MIIIMVFWICLCDFSPPNPAKGGLKKGFYQIFNPHSGGRGAKLTDGCGTKRGYKEGHRGGTEKQRVTTGILLCELIKFKKTFINISMNVSLLGPSKR
jgi:hypothetical protein